GTRAPAAAAAPPGLRAARHAVACAPVGRLAPRRRLRADPGPARLVGAARRQALAAPGGVPVQSRFLPLRPRRRRRLAEPSGARVPAEIPQPHALDPGDQRRLVRGAQGARLPQPPGWRERVGLLALVGPAAD